MYHGGKGVEGTEETEKETERMTDKERESGGAGWVRMGKGGSEEAKVLYSRYSETHRHIQHTVSVGRRGVEPAKVYLWSLHTC